MEVILVREGDNTKPKSFQIVIVAMKIVKQDTVWTVVEYQVVSLDQGQGHLWGAGAGKEAEDSGLLQQTEGAEGKCLR